MGSLKGWKSILVGFLALIAGLLEQIDWISVIPEGADAGTITSLAGVVILILRYFTSTPVGKKE